MFKNLARIKDFIYNRQYAVVYNMDVYQKNYEKIETISLEKYSEEQLKEKATELKDRARKKKEIEPLLVEAFALVREVSKRVVEMNPFGVQVMAGIALHQGKIVEMQTGEGKTLAAVMPAYLNALTGRGVHLLTFNDYLAGRDAAWMAPIYEFLGLSVGVVKEGMNVAERQKAYSSDVTYVTAKEAGFDYLRDSLCLEKDKLVHRPFHYAIVDEADSILIDESRIPLVIAGDVSDEKNSYLGLASITRELEPERDYQIDQNGSIVSLTDSGLFRVEKILKLGNLYDAQNLKWLAGINNALQAEVLLKRDKDYIVRNGKIELVDEHTGRIADKRHWPDELQTAVEAKEGVQSEAKGMVLGSIALQHYLSLYPKICGMTGTARTSIGELNEFYGMEVVVIPTNKPCYRLDHPDIIFTHRDVKQKAIIKEIKRAHRKNQPVLVGTGSVQESEILAKELKEAGIECSVLNAKNDEMEAKIIARAGEPGAVTVSTNMAGRGVDIKLGGEWEQEKEKVVEAGGLYVLGTTLYESRRIDNQLRGRAGRQGDPGESRFFISLEDELVEKHTMKKLLPDQYNFLRQEDPINDLLVRRELARGQRIVEGYHEDIRRQLWKYSEIIEQQRRIMHAKREQILKDEIAYHVFEEKAPEKYEFLLCELGEEVVKKAEKQIVLYFLNKGWAEYLDHISYIRESIHLVVIGKKDPVSEFHRNAIEAFDKMLEEIEEEIIRTLKSVEISENGIDMEKENLKTPSSTWTYLLNDSPNQFSNLPFLFKTATSSLRGSWK